MLQLFDTFHIEVPAKAQSQCDQHDHADDADSSVYHAQFRSISQQGHQRENRRADKWGVNLGKSEKPFVLGG